MNDVPLREHVRELMLEREKAQNATFQATLRETELKSMEVERRLGQLNELRNEVLTDRARFIERTEVDLQLKNIREKIESLSEWKSKTIGYISAVIFIISILSSFIATTVTIWIQK